VRKEAAKKPKGLWVLAALVPFGVAAWAGFLYAGIKAHVTRWKVYAALYLVAAFIPFFMAGMFEDDSAGNSLAGGLIILVWVVAFCHSLVARPMYVRRMEFADQLTAARDRLEQRDQVRQIAKRDPRLAAELGVGRPDRRGALDAGLVDVNSAPLRALERLPGVDRDLAEHIIYVREQIDGFSSLEDFGLALDLPGNLVEDLRERTIFLPR
jgi:Helix-hairpin-helix motif